MPDSSSIADAAPPLLVGLAVGVVGFLVTRTRTRLGADFACRSRIRASLDLLKQAAKWEQRRPRNERAADQSFVHAYKDLRIHIYIPPSLSLLLSVSLAFTLYKAQVSWTTWATVPALSSMLYYQSICGVVSRERQRTERMEAASDRMKSKGQSLKPAAKLAADKHASHLNRVTRAIDWLRSVSSLTYATAIRNFADEYARSNKEPDHAHMRSVGCTSGILAYVCHTYDTKVKQDELTTYFRPDLTSEQVTPLRHWLDVTLPNGDTQTDNETPTANRMASDSILMRALKAVEERFSDETWTLDMMEQDLRNIANGNLYNRRREERQPAHKELSVSFFKAGSGEQLHTVKVLLVNETKTSRGYWIPAQEFPAFRKEMANMHMPLVRQTDASGSANGNGRKLIQPIRFTSMKHENHKGYLIGAILREA